VLLDAIVILVVVSLIGWVWFVGPVRWFRSRKGRLPDVWI
jgi:hypothetical protein